MPRVPRRPALGYVLSLTPRRHTRLMRFATENLIFVLGHVLICVESNFGQPCEHLLNICLEVQLLWEHHTSWNLAFNFGGFSPLFSSPSEIHALTATRSPRDATQLMAGWYIPKIKPLSHYYIHSLLVLLVESTSALEIPSRRPVRMWVPSLTWLKALCGKKITHGQTNLTTNYWLLHWFVFMLDVFSGI